MTPYSLVEVCCIDVLEELVASIIRFEENAKEVASNKSVYCLLSLFFDPETQEKIYQKTRSQIADDSTPSRHCENLKSKLLNFSSFILRRYSKLGPDKQIQDRDRTSNY
jgi:hypothetical protein